MADYTLFATKVVTPDGTEFDGKVRELEVTSVAGGLGILARRAPIVTDLRMGHVRALLEDGTWRTWATAEGFVQASDSVATVIVEDAIDAAKIDADQAQSFITEGNERLKLASDSQSHETSVEAARREIAWGEHLLAIRAAHG
jgi:F-type H+-transporting ATPase subunit epsilon